MNQKLDSDDNHPPSGFFIKIKKFFKNPFFIKTQSVSEVTDFLRNAADLNIIDFDAMRLHRPEAVFDSPAGGRRLVQRPEGYEITIKAGEVIFDNGVHTGALPGKLVRRSNEKKLVNAI